MKVNALIDKKKTLVFFLLQGLFMVSYGQNDQSTVVAKGSQINLQERSYAEWENKGTAIQEKLTSEDTFSLGKGAVVQAPTDHSKIATPSDGTFSGVPNNGTMKIDMKVGYNLVGNPYPSGINVHDFIDSNTTITGTIYFLKKTNATSNTDVSSYATLTKTAYVSNDSMGEDASMGYFKTGDEPNWFINMAQGFFVDATSDSKLLFTNRMRRITRVDPNFKNSQIDTAKKRGMYWLNLTNEAGAYSQMAVGYSSEGTIAEDQGIDGRNINLDFYLASLIVGNDYAIQGRAAFTSADMVSLSYKVESSGNYSITIDHVAGIFKDNSQAIYIWDKVKNKVHNLNTGAYSFFSKVGAFEERFQIVYEPR